jgi:hypothetical protein
MTAWHKQLMVTMCVALGLIAALTTRGEPGAPPASSVVSVARRGHAWDRHSQHQGQDVTTPRCPCRGHTQQSTCNHTL